ncbi:unnamed protein product [Penicillium roqueforti FM164]|uniref:Genomic scaffold, ProqFM164S03 n=1 Tax=Penicillium roqueforti (strain FM164) TaxID=1365484 RepID=W6QC83_PENRF|nr:unnamed protein product [Penicillium roqueforti FM164]
MYRTSSYSYQKDGYAVGERVPNGPDTKFSYSILCSSPSMEDLTLVRAHDNFRFIHVDCGGC